MIKNRKIIIGSRGSKLSLAYSQYVKKLLLTNNPHFNNSSITIKIIKTSGDIYKNRSVSEIGGKGVFSKQIEEELLKSKIDIAVHSLKDLPSKITDGLTINAVIKRNDPRDAFISYSCNSFFQLKSKSRIGTSSLRRKAQLNKLRNDVSIVPMRGNIDTRIKKLKDKEFDAIVLSLAGIKMLKLDKEVKEIFTTEQMLPAIGQGAIAVQARKDDKEILDITNLLNDKETYLCTMAERSMLEAIGGDCNTAVGGLAKISKKEIFLESELFSDDEDKKFEVKNSGTLEEAKEIGYKAGKELLKKAGSNFKKKEY